MRLQLIINQINLNISVATATDLQAQGFSNRRMNRMVSITVNTVDVGVCPAHPCPPVTSLVTTLVTDPRYDPRYVRPDPTPTPTLTISPTLRTGLRRGYSSQQAPHGWHKVAGHHG